MKINNDLTPPLYKGRASGVQNILANGKPAEELSAGAKTSIIEWYTSKLYGVKKFTETKITQKGTLGEDSAIEYVNSVNGTDWKKNEEHFENDYITGTPDIVLEDEIIDIKMAYDCYSFGLFNPKLTSLYVTQLQVYMWLTGKRKARVVRVLMDTPDELCPYGADPKDFKYSHLPSNLRIKEFVVEYDEEKIELIKAKVLKARSFVSNLSY